MTDQIARLLDQIDRLDQETTPGPWISKGITPDHGLMDGIEVYQEGEKGAIAYVQPAQDDAEFIALARTALPTLSRAVREVLKECKEAHERYARDRYDVDREGQARMAEIVEDALTDALKGAGND